MEEKVDQVLDAVKNKTDIHDSVGDLVSMKQQTDKEELKEVIRLHTYIIIFGVKESSDKEVEVQIKADENLTDE
jgi:hypothetical protein